MCKERTSNVKNISLKKQDAIHYLMVITQTHYHLDLKFCLAI